MPPRAESTPFRGIYAIRHVASGKFYVGSSVNFSKRWRRHRHDLRGGQHHSCRLQRAWNKYGEQAFVFEILEAVSDKADLIRVEQEYLDGLESCRRTKGYNVSPTAGSNLGVACSDEHRRRISEANRNRYAEMRRKGIKREITDETRAKLAAAMTGKRFPGRSLEGIRRFNATRVWTPEVRARIAEASRERALNSSAEIRAKIAEANRGQKRSPETRERIAVAVRAYYQRKRERGDMQASFDFPDQVSSDA